MHRVLLLGSCLCTGVASADIRLDTEPVPELFALEAAFHLDRGQYWGSRTKSGIVGSIGAGYGRFDEDDTGTLVGAIAAGKYTETWLALASSELVMANEQIWRGHHVGLVGLHSKEDSADGLGGRVTLETTLDHGEARGLAPVRLGQGRYRNGDVGGEALLHLGDDDDMVFVAQLFGELGTTRWDSPLLDHANRGSIGLGIGLTPADGELPRGSVDLLRGRVEHVTIRRPIVAARATAPLGDTSVRVVELGLGAHEMTLHIDRELLAVIEGDLGWSWIEADASMGRIDDNMFRMKLATALKWRTDRSRQARRLGIGVAREPGYTPDGQRLVVDWRTDLTYGVDTPVYALKASGGLSWIKTVAGGWMPSLPRYGTSVELFFKIALGFEGGGYFATSYENQLAGDPWAAARAWNTETGLLLRWRRDPDLAPPVAQFCRGEHSH
ncbi:MAG: hypothetical protein ACKV2T_08675 [Kofleriaceae bacterium]